MNSALQVLAAAEARASALANADAAQLARLLHDRFRWTTHLGETVHREEYIRRNTDGRTVWRSQQLRNAEVVVAGDTAVLYTEVTDVVARDGSEASFRMPVTQVWVQHTGEWTCLAGHAGPLID